MINIIGGVNMKKPKYMSRLLAYIFLWLGLAFIVVGYLCFSGIMKPSAQSVIQDSATMGMIFSIIGITCCVVQIISKVINYRQEKLHKDLLINGTRLIGTIEKVYLQKWIKSGNKSPFRICYTYSYHNKIYHHKSYLIWDKPNFIKDDPIEIYVNASGKSTIKF